MVNKVLLYSTGNSTKYCVITYKGKESEKVCVCVCVCVYIHICHSLLQGIFLTRD